MINSLEIQHENLNNIQNVFLAKVSLEVAKSSNKLDKSKSISLLNYCKIK